jgi:hypothetical protein
MNIYINLGMGLLLSIGMLFLCIGLGLNYSRKKKYKNCTAITKGKVVNVVKRSYGEGSIDEATTCMFHPVIEYSVNNEKYVKTHAFGAVPSKYEVGQEVEIHYNPENCEKYYIEGEKNQKILGIVFTIAGSIIIFAGILVTILLSNIL